MMPSWSTRTGSAAGPSAENTRDAIAACTLPIPPGAAAASSVSSRASARRSASAIELHIYPQLGLRIALRLADSAPSGAAQEHVDRRRRLQVAPPDLLLRPVDVDPQVIGRVLLVGARERVPLAGAPARDGHLHEPAAEHGMRGRAQDRLHRMVDRAVVEGELCVTFRHRSIAARC